LKLPYYNFSCNACETVFEKKLAFEDLDLPTTEKCPTCEKEGTVAYMPSFSGIGDPIKLGITRPPDAFMHGVLGRMQHSCPVGTKVDSHGKTQIKYADFSNKRFQPGRLV
jgi:putative FmdB family regulatory protein